MNKLVLNFLFYFILFLFFFFNYKAVLRKYVIYKIQNKITKIIINNYNYTSKY